MSSQLISRSDDLRQLRDDGYDIAIVAGHLVIRQIPYVDVGGQIQCGSLVTELALANDCTVPPPDHTVRFIGTQPYDAAGAPLDKMVNSSGDQVLADGLTINFSFSQKPPEGYPDHHSKMTAYIRMLANPARALDSTVTATPFPLQIDDNSSESPFAYTDTSSSRSRIGSLSTKFLGQRIAIIGLGGTGSYILDLVAKTPVAEIHLFDADDFIQHNAFRAPGAATGDELSERPLKVDFFQRKYSALHRGVVAHPEFLTADTVEVLEGFDFTFVAIDDGEAKRPVVEALERFNIAFIDCGMGLIVVDGQISGSVRSTFSAPEHREHVRARRRIPFATSNDDGEYGRNIQLADLNALNAVMAVIRWKRYLGFYADLEHEFNSVFTIDGNHLLNEDNAE